MEATIGTATANSKTTMKSINKINSQKSQPFEVESYVQLPLEVLNALTRTREGKTLSANDVLVYVLLLHYQGERQNTLVSWRTLSTHIDLTVYEVANCVEALEDAGFIKIARNAHNGLDVMSCLLVVQDGEVVDRRNQHHMEAEEMKNEDRREEEQTEDPETVAILQEEWRKAHSKSKGQPPAEDGMF